MSVFSLQSEESTCNAFHGRMIQYRSRPQLLFFFLNDIVTFFVDVLRSFEGARHVNCEVGCMKNAETEIILRREYDGTMVSHSSSKFQPALR